MILFRQIALVLPVFAAVFAAAVEEPGAAASDKRNPWFYAVPLMLEPKTEPDWNEVVRLLKRVEADRVLLVGPSEERGDRPSAAQFRELTEILKERKSLFEEAGISVGFWMWRTIGHGGTFILSREERLPYQEIVGYDGQTAVKCFCPMDPKFRQYMRDIFTEVAGSGVEFILLDDDFRLSWHPPEVRIGCYCPLHIARFNEVTGKSLSRQQIAEAVLTGPPSETRTAWLKLNDRVLRDFAWEIEQAVHSVSPTTRIGLAMTRLLWEIEGTDVVTLLRTLAGPTRPFARVGGAPYGLKQPNLLGPTLGTVILQKEWLRDSPDIELMSESDTWPHTRFQCPAEMLDAFQEGLMAANYPGHLFYIFTYAPRPTHEMGYVRMAEDSLNRYRAIWSLFESFESDRGAMVIDLPYTWKHLTLPDDPQEALAVSGQKGAAIRWLSRIGVPVAYRDSSGPAVLEGTGWVTLGEERLSSLLLRGVLIDGVAARQLQERGVDVGIKSMTPVKPPVFEHYADPAFSGRYAGENVRLYMEPNKQVFRCAVSPDARVISFFETQGRERFPATFLYENARAQRFCVLPFEIRRVFEDNDGSQILLDYAKQEQIVRALGWVNRTTLAASIPGEPDVRVVVKTKGNAALIALQALRLDPLKDPVIRLDPAIPVNGAIDVLMPHSDKLVSFDNYRYSHTGDAAYLELRLEVPAMGMVCVRIGTD